MYWLLVHGSGVPPLEAHMLSSRGNAFREYQQRVNAFWPGPQNDSGAVSTGGEF
jgi:steroid 5-alpha reductase family enzyme